MRFDTSWGHAPPQPDAIGRLLAPGPGYDWSDEMRALREHRDTASFMRIYDYFAPRLHHYLGQLGNAPEQAEELAQETLLQIWNQADRFDPSQARLSTWMFRIARNLSIDAYRRDGRWSALQTGLTEAESVADGPSVEPDALDARQQTRMREAIAELPAIQAHVVTLSYFEARTHREIAEQLAIPLGTVKSHLRLALTRLRSRFTSPQP